MARNKPSRKRKPQPKNHIRIKQASRWRVIPHVSSDDNTGLIFTDFHSAADYCMDNDIPYLFEESTGTGTMAWIVGVVGDNVSMTAMPFSDFMSMLTVHPFICPHCNNDHLPPA